MFPEGKADNWFMDSNGTPVIQRTRKRVVYVLLLGHDEDTSNVWVQVLIDEHVFVAPVMKRLHVV